MKQCCRTLYVFIFFLCLCSHSWAEISTIKIQEGNTQQIKLDFLATAASVGNNSICRASLLDDRKTLVLIAGIPGQTNIIVTGDQVQKEIIVDVHPAISTAHLKKLFRNIDTIEIQQVGQQIVFEGCVLKKSDLNKIRTVVDASQNVLNWGVAFCPRYFELVGNEILQEMRKFGVSYPSIRTVGESFVIKGKTNSDERKNRIGTALNQMFDHNIINDLSLFSPVTLITMNIRVLEIRRNVLKKMNITWNPINTVSGEGSYSGKTGERPFLSGALKGTISNLLPQLGNMVEKNAARALMEENISTLIGQTGEISYVSKVPIRIQNDDGDNTVKMFDVGVSLKFSPIIDAHRHIISPIFVESSFIAKHTKNGDPVIKSMKLSTNMRVENNQSIVLAGFSGQRENQDYSNNPIALIQFNRSKGRNTDADEIIVIVTPKIGDIKNGDRKINKKFNEKERQNIKATGVYLK